MPHRPALERQRTCAPPGHARANLARLAHETPEQEELPALEAMLDELAAASGALPDEALASEVRCPHDVPPATIVVPLQALRTLAASADGTLAARIDRAARSRTRRRSRGWCRMARTARSRR